MKKNLVFYVSLLITVAIVVIGLIIPESFASAMNVTKAFLVETFGWFYLIAMFIFVIFSLMIAFSRFGTIKLGPDDSVPEFSNKSWFAMLFGAGMGIGLVFWGVAEPLNHFSTFGGTEQAADLAMQKSFLHWGFHPWAAYSIIGLALGYFQFRKNAPGLISSIFLPLLGEEGVKGPIGKLIDIFAIFATVAGIATSLGQGTLQINSGLNYLFNIPTTRLVQIVIILGLTIVYTGTAVSGIDKGIKILSDINLYLAITILVGAFIVGPKIMSLNIFTNSFGGYINNFIAESFSINPFGDNSWLGSWTIFYWSWWIAWGPFVGTFIARISKGRTIKEFVLGVIIAPSMVSFIWFSIFGSLGLNLDSEIINQAKEVTETALFVVFAEYPLGLLFSIIAICLLCTFFITSANSGIFVLSMFSSEGDLNPSNDKKILWGIIQALLALVLLMTGGLDALQTCSIVAALPLTVIMLLSAGCLLKALMSESRDNNKIEEIPILKNE
ncbi:BCCT family transporter [Enterococcus hermanniensis]|uniref:Betaine/carnitine/choline transporter (BCCT) family transporter n=1 Tax=Enterococcus hermanniensis TaxID=249189 RepID=A0A1L8TLS8_9ENTE|nr:BCCT family transporter [Enterococcus hermanniensis]OJG45240.1 betaine/carnitine/choline transporter (BCCT) family transporter [Enterococcus hermanniensis]